MKESGYKKLHIYKRKHQLAVQIHIIRFTLPHFELYEEASQIRRSPKSISSNIVEGFSLRRYKNEYIRFLSFVYARCEEIREHLEYLYETGSLKNHTKNDEISKSHNDLSDMIFSFIRSVEEKHVHGYKVTDISEDHYPDCHQSSVICNL